MKSESLWIGTSGWMYKHWKDIFYPNNLKTTEWLEYFSNHYSTVEINNSFYRLPETKVFLSWYKKTPKNFIFSVKVSRYITHIKRLNKVRSEWKTFVQRSSGLKEKSGPHLLQFPPTFVMTEETTERLIKFLKYASKTHIIVLEFRHSSWFSEEVYRIVTEHNATVVFADSSRYPKTNEVTNGSIYIRMHGPKGLFSSEYTLEEMKILAGKIDNFINQGRKIFVYFNNDVNGYALKNASQLNMLIKLTPVN